MESPYRKLEALVKKDAEVRAQLIERGELFGGYHPEMEAVHTANGRILESLLKTHGWPDAVRDGEAAQTNAWLIVMHAISLPSLQRKVLALLKEHPSGSAPSELAMLEDRTLVFSGQKQKYGTQFDWDATGKLNPFPTEEEENVDKRRAEVGLSPLAEAIRKSRERSVAEGETPPKDFARYSQAREAWMLRVGWIRDVSEIDPGYAQE